VKEVKEQRMREENKRDIEDHKDYKSKRMVKRSDGFEDLKMIESIKKEMIKSKEEKRNRTKKEKIEEKEERIRLKKKMEK
jgi:hypothetical protein